MKDQSHWITAKLLLRRTTEWTKTSSASTGKMHRYPSSDAHGCVPKSHNLQRQRERMVVPMAQKSWNSLPRTSQARTWVTVFGATGGFNKSPSLQRKVVFCTTDQRSIAVVYTEAVKLIWASSVMTLDALRSFLACSPPLWKMSHSDIYCATWFWRFQLELWMAADGDKPHSVCCFSLTVVLIDTPLLAWLSCT